MDLHRISAQALSDEAEAVTALLSHVGEVERYEKTARKRAAQFIRKQREKGGSAAEAFLQAYGLSTEEGIALLCLAEALLRIPDSDTADRLIEETFEGGNWKQHLGERASLFMNASHWALYLTGSVLRLDEGESPGSWLGGLIKKSGEPVIRTALRAAMKFLGSQFVMGESIDDAMKQARAEEAKGYSISYDMLGEGARSETQAQHYLQSYREAIARVGAVGSGTLFARNSVSIKLSALHSRYQATQESRVFVELYPRLKSLLMLAKQHGIAVALDAEEASRLDLQLELYQRLLQDPDLVGFEGIGFVLQAYQKRAIHIAQALAGIAQQGGRRIPVRLVKGAYWDGEIKQAQVMGLEHYPVFTRKEYTDLSYLACAQELLQSPQHIYPQFATHNALTAVSIIELAGAQAYEFQRLHGMGESLYDQLVAKHRCRIYAPVGEHKDLLAYLIRRLIENGANTSFVHLLMDRATPIESLTQSPVGLARAYVAMPRPIPLPRDLYGLLRKNPQGIDFGYRAVREKLVGEVAAALKQLPAAPGETKDIAALISQAQRSFADWERTPVAKRADMLRRAADMLEVRRAQFMALCIDEGKKTYADALAEVREAADFLRYYALQAETSLRPKSLPSPTGESNLLSLHGRGVFVCISPWNFPLAIFTGQIAAALVTGNTVIAKPAEQTPAIATAMVALLHEAGVPKDVLQLAVGDGKTGAALVADPRIAGVCFTGSTEVARSINRALAAKDGPIVPFIAETGGQNAMIVDSTALPEAAVDDIIASAFGSAGQRCSALRAVFVQEDIAENLRALLQGAMDELCVGPAQQLSTDVPPVIDADAQQALLQHIDAMKKQALWWHAVPEAPGDDTYVTPHLFGLKDLSVLTKEHFGPVLHWFTYKAGELSKVIDAIHATGYGLTFGLHSRLRGSAEDVLAQVRAGNRYVNRSMIGAVVGVQPFGGEGLSGTGPKAGGPHYLLRFVTERTTSINTAAIGGNIELLS